jgi:SPP1 family predicted phage head-tail adaptor
MAGQLGGKVSIGQLRHRVTIQTPTVARDEFQGRVEGWTVVASPVRARVVPTGGRELFQNGAVQANATHRVTLRYRGDLGPKCRLVWLDTGLVLNVVACPPSVGTANVVEVWCIQEART